MSRAGWSIIMVGNAASYRAFSLLEEHRAELNLRYPDRYLVRGEELLRRDLDELKRIGLSDEGLLLIDGALLKDTKDGVAGTFGVRCDWSGVFGGLWKLGELAGCGFCVKQSQIPVFQFSIELCDLYDESLFEVDSAGTVLVLTSNGNALVDRLAEFGIGACEIGYVTANNDRIVKNGENVRFINKVR